MNHDEQEALRTVMAAAALIGILANQHNKGVEYKTVAEEAVRYADTVLTILQAETKENKHG